MIHKMLALYNHIPEDILVSHSNSYGLAVEPMKDDRKVLVADFLIEVDEVEFAGITLIDYDSSKNLSDFFYRPASAASVSPFPTLFINYEGIINADGEIGSDSKIYKKIMRILDNNCKIEPKLSPISVYLKEHASELLSAISSYLSVKLKELFVFTIRINGDFIGKSGYFEAVRRQAELDYFADCYTYQNKKIIGKDQTCSVCKNISKEVWGYVSTYNFYTSKTEFAPIAGGFDKRKAHKNYPVCPVCSSKLDKLKPIVDKYLSFKFCGFNYLMVPEVLDASINDHAMDEIISIMISQYALQNVNPGTNTGALGSFTLGEKHKLLNEYTREVFYLLADTQQYANYTMLFYAVNNAEFKVLCTIENIFPTQFQNIFESKARAEAHSVFKLRSGFQSSTEVDLEFRFELLKEIFPLDSKIYGDFSKAFLEIVRSIFLQRKVSYTYLIQRVIAMIQSRFINEEYYEQAAIRAFLIFKFFYYLQIIEYPKYESMEVNVNEKYQSFFDEHSEFFFSPARKGIFLMGILCQYLLSIQYQERGAQPFRKKLNGLKLSPQAIEKLLPEIIQKLEEYGKNYYSELERDIASLLIKEDLKSLSNNDISYLFVLGMSLAKDFKATKEEN